MGKFYIKPCFSATNQSIIKINKNTACGSHVWLLVLDSEKSKSKRGHNSFKYALRVISRDSIGCYFDSEHYVRGFK